MLLMVTPTGAGRCHYIWGDGRRLHGEVRFDLGRPFETTHLNSRRGTLTAAVQFVIVTKYVGWDSQRGIEAIAEGADKQTGTAEDRPTRTPL